MAAGKKENQNADHMIRPVAYIHTDFPTKFGIPRQSGLTGDLEAKIVFEPEFSNPEAIRGIEEFSHLWLIWEFSEAKRTKWSPTVRPPRLGGNVRKGVFATRSPFRPNSIGLSSVRLTGVELHTQDGPVLRVSGADLVDGTPIFDIKPYLPYSDCHPDAVDAFDGKRSAKPLTVVFPPELEALIPEEKRLGLRQALACGPIPGYQHDPNRRYGFNFCGRDVRFTIDGDTLTVVEIVML